MRSLAATGFVGRSMLEPLQRENIYRRAVMVLVLLLALLVRIDRARREPVVNPDVVRFIQQARALSIDPFAAMRAEVYHPLHAALGAMFHLVTARFTADDRAAWVAALRADGIFWAVVVTWVVSASARLAAPWWAACGAGILWAVGRPHQRITAPMASPI